MTRDDFAAHIRGTLDRARLAPGTGYPMFATYLGPAGIAFVPVPPSAIAQSELMNALGPLLADLAERMRATMVGMVMPVMSELDWENAKPAEDVPTDPHMGRIEHGTEMILVTVVSAAGADVWGADVLRPDSEPPFLRDWRRIAMRHCPYTDPIMMRLAALRN